MGDRIYVADSQESVFYMKYKKAENQLYIYADDTSSRYLTTQLQLDYDTLCGADKFGNIFMMRLPSDLSQQVSLSVLAPCSCATDCLPLLFHLGSIDFAYTLTSLRIADYILGLSLEHELHHVCARQRQGE